MERLRRDLTPAELAPKLLVMSRVDLVPLVNRAVRSTPSKGGHSLGDGSMSGWSRRSQIEIEGRAARSGDDVEIVPKGRAAGPMRVLESGRKSYQVGDVRHAGFRTRKRTGERVAKSRKVKRVVGSVEGKGTWSRAAEEIARVAPPLANRIKQQAIARQFGR